jgi:putative transposase
MKLTPDLIKQLEKDLENCQTSDDLLGKNGVIKNLVKGLSEQILQAELTNHLGYEKHAVEGQNSGNSRNGASSKTVQSDFGDIELKIPRDRNAEFEPKLVPKHQRNIGKIDEIIVSLYAKGLSTRDIKEHLEELYGLDASATFISGITERIRETAIEWQSRPLESLYVIVYLDAIFFKIREDSKVISKAAYTCLGIDKSGHKDLLGIWIDQSEGANFWLSVLTDLRNRGVQDILIACVDGLKGFPEAIQAIFPHTEVQQCVIHQIRNSMRYIASKNQKEFIKDLKTVYQSPTLEGAELALNRLEEKWGKKYPVVLNSWKNNWPNLSVYFKYPEEIRRIIYTTNIVEALHRQMRKVTKTKSLFPHDDALKKMLFLSYLDIQKKWTAPIQNWAFIISQLSINFKDRVKLDF